MPPSSVVETEGREAVSLVRGVVPVLFFATGAAGLMLQVAWFRMLALSLGGTLAAATVTLSAFMLGLAVGAAAYARRARRVPDPLGSYGRLEIAAGILALLTPLALGLLDDAYSVLGSMLGEWPALLHVVRFVLAGLVLVPPTACMGATLPALAQALVRRAAASGGGTGGLAAFNTMGAVAGTLLALFVVMPRYGLTACVVIAGTIDIVSGVVALAVSRRARPRAVAAPTPSEAVPAHPRTRVVAGLLLLAGAAGMAYEVLWTRALAFSFGSGAQAFALMLAVVLVGWALGAFLGGELADRLGRPLLVLGASQVLLPVAVAWQVYRLPQLPDFMYLLAVRLEGVDAARLGLLFLLGTAQVLLPAAVLMGMALPSGVRALARDGGAGDAAGTLFSANSVGTIPGAIVAAWVLVPALGLQRALVATAVLSAAIGLFALAIEVRDGRLHARRPIFAGLLLCGLFAILFHVDRWRVYSGSGVFRDDHDRSTLLEVAESSHGAVTLSRIEDKRGHWLSLSVDAVNVAGTNSALLSCQEIQGQLPLLLHAAPRRVLHVGFGSGGTARAVATHPEIDRLDIVEINPAVLRMADRAMRDVNDGVLADPRVRVHLEDGRNFLLASRERWDCILSDSIHPRYPGNATLYTVDYFRLCRSRLAEGGVVSTWLPVYSLTPESLRSIVRSMREVFPQTSAWYLNSTVNEFVVIIGRTDGAAIDVARMEEAFAQPAVAASLARVGLETPLDVLDFLVAEGDELGALASDARLHRDDHPWVELESAALLDRDGSWRVNLQQILDARRPIGPRLRNASPEFLAALALREAATTVQLRGQTAVLARDVAGASSAFRQAASMPGHDGEPWDAFGAPPWVREMADAGARAAASAR